MSPLRLAVAVRSMSAGNGGRPAEGQDLRGACAKIVPFWGVLVMLDASKSLRLTAKDSACVPRFCTVAETVCAVLTTTGDGAVTEATATS